MIMMQLAYATARFWVGLIRTISNAAEHVKNIILDVQVLQAVI
jgi:hypothetical protein